MSASVPKRGRPARQAVDKRFEAAIDELANYGGLPKPYEAKGLWDRLWHLEAHHSTAIEGNTLVLREVEQLLEQGRAVGAKELKDYLEVLGYGEAAKWVYEQALQPAAGDQLITLQEVRQIHKVALSGAWDVTPHPDANDSEGPGNFREHEIAPFAHGMTPPSFPLVHAELTNWVDRANDFGVGVADGSILLAEVPEWLAQMHRNFEHIHPFIDGNGRTGRLCLNLILVRLGWPPAIVFKDQRKKYLKALDRADNEDFGPLAELLSRSVIDNLHTLIPNIAGPAKYVPLPALVDDDFSLVALKAAAARGRLEAIRGTDGQWRSSRAAVDAYKESRFKRKPRDTTF
ncbi:Fic family protein [Curtobacterium sp. TC1]|nr:Fic family protein [Curtobacterium sp. TC1]